MTADGEDELEKMLAEAQRLALRMRTAMANSGHTEALAALDAMATSSASFDLPSLSGEEQQATGQLTLEEHFELNGGSSSKELDDSSNYEEKSLADKSAASAQYEEVEAAIKATREMELALQALGGSLRNVNGKDDDDSSTEDGRKKRTAVVTPRNNGSNQSRDSPISPPTPYPASPSTVKRKIEAFQDRERNRSYEDSIQWEKIDSVHEDDDDFVPIQDYSPQKKSQKQRQTRVDEHGITWETMDTAAQHDEDYVPLSDYSRTARNGEEPGLGASSFRLRAVQKKRRRQQKRRRMMRAVALALVVLYAIYYHFTSDNQVTDSKDVAQEAEPAPPMDDFAADVDEEDLLDGEYEEEVEKRWSEDEDHDEYHDGFWDDYGTLLDDEIDDFEDVEEESDVSDPMLEDVADSAEEIEAADAEKMATTKADTAAICDVAFSFVSPLCRQQRSQEKRPLERQAVEALIDTMLQ